MRATRGYRKRCVALPEGGDDTCCSASSPPTEACVAGNGGVRSPRDNGSSPARGAIGARAEIATASTAAVGDQGRVVRPTQVNRRKRRKQRQAKGADRLGPKRYVARSGGCNVPRRRRSATGVKAGPNP